MAKDINSHQHISGVFKDDVNFYDNKMLVKKTFSKVEGLELSKLFKEFYLLKDKTELTKGQNKEINEKLIPEITKAILNILAPCEKD